VPLVTIRVLDLGHLNARLEPRPCARTVDRVPLVTIRVLILGTSTRPVSNLRSATAPRLRSIVDDHRSNVAATASLRGRKHERSHLTILGTLDAPGFESPQRDRTVDGAQRARS
jgi:hypothetical protein